MADKAHTLTDKELEKMERHLAGVYKRAEKEVGAAWSAYLKDVEGDISQLQKAYEEAKKGGDKDAIKKAGRELQGKIQEKTLYNQHYQNLTNQVATQISHINETAAAYINDKLPKVYAINYNDVAGGINSQIKGVSFDLVDQNTVKRLATKQENLLPYKEINGKKDVRWNVSKINSEVLQGIIQGESMPNVAKRLTNVLGMNTSSAIRNARTTVTSAENRGRMDMLHDAQDKGVNMVKVWMATNDGRTRDAHLDLDGEEAEIDEPFTNEFGDIMYPGDPDADPANVYNCRCTLTYKVVGFGEQTTELEEYEENGFTGVVDGEDISDTWERRPDQFDFEINDIINAQGFDGNPRVVPAEEFDKAVNESNFIAQRVYSAPDQETLDEYRNSLYRGEWYVDCSAGGSAYGRGMYSVYNNGTSITEYMEREMNGYRARRGIDFSYTETFTLVPNAKTITPNEIQELRNNYQKKLMEEFKNRGGWKSEEAINWASNRDIHGLDDGSVAALFGYDAILTHGIDDYAVVLNRTKIIFKGE